MAHAPPELTPRAMIAGLVGGILFGCANAYAALRVGLAVGTSIPIAILSVAVFRVLARALGRAGILEVNMAQTIGSASSSMAAGLVFTIPALYLWGERPSPLRVALLGMAGGLLGVLAMIPLRRLLIVRAHGELPYPEGTACAEVLHAADRGGTRARGILQGLGVAALFKLLADWLRLIPRHVDVALPGIPAGRLSLEPSAMLGGIGYILGFRVASVMVGGALLASTVLIPLVAQFGAGLSAPMFPETARRIAEMTPADLWSRYVRYIGAGAVAAAGILTVIRSLPTMWESFRLSIGGLRAAGGPAARREDRDLPSAVVVGGFLALVLALALVPGLLGRDAGLGVRLLGGLAIAFFGFFFATVAARIVGLLGTTSNPISGMTIVTMLGTSALLLAIGQRGLPGQILAITVGTVVCTAAAMAGDISQDLKTGFLVGATPRRQQVGEIVCVVVAAPFIALTITMLGTHGFGTPELPAPQATLMKTVVEGVLSRELPWGLVLTGAALAVVAELLAIPSLAFAVGIYLPLSTMMPIFLGGLLRRVADRRLGTRAEEGVLVASGLVAGEAIVGVLLQAWAIFHGRPRGLGVSWGAAGEVVVGLAAMGLVLSWIYGSARRAPAPPPGSEPPSATAPPP